MPDLWKNKIPIIRSSLDEGWLRQGDMPTFAATGAIPRDYDEDPPLMGDSPDGLKLLSDPELVEAFEEQENAQSSLEHMYMRTGSPAFRFADQGRFLDCWTHSTIHCHMFDRLKQNLEPIDFNGVAMATLMGKTRGGWSGLSLKFSREHGLPVTGTGPGEWPFQSRDGRDTPALRANMARFKAEEDWYDLGKREYDQELSRQQLLTLGSQNIPCGVDYNRFGHAMCQVRVVRIGNVWSPMVLNSWKSWGYHGLGILYGMWPDNAVALRASTPSSR